MTNPAAPPAATRWRSSRARLRDTLLAAAAPVVACAVALGGLTTWARSGAAGSPPRIGISDSRVFLPYGDGRYTSAYFRIANSGDAGDELISVTSPEMDEAMLSRDRSNGEGGASMTMVRSAAVPGGGTLTMSPYGLNVMVRTRARTQWQPGDTVPFVLHFRHSGPRKTLAVVVRPGSD
ncbi:copper chaperone PCu(A)C [Streptomyces corynorhini]|uniref:Copper chaperone PCu(A)C n=1 Tax=Streptomyces corynorhini TaxID=2282652 RepID=A0A370B866_9ACTN|nr:copper chaperone PCu(A)C [Streptomyces corynorhini]RDG37801.1 copper chaperone PCu(A)C [Streptomyces corynorhini]